MAANIRPLLTVADLDACPDDNNRYELIEGELFVSRSPEIPHQRVILNLEIKLVAYLAENPIAILVPGTGVVFSDYDAVIPDLVLVHKERWDQIVLNDRFVGPPDLVVEVLSPGKENRERDLLVKRQLYAKYGVAEYWILDTENQSVLVYRLKEQTLEEIAALREEDEVSSPLIPGFSQRVSPLFNL